MVEADLISKWNSLKGSEVVDRFRESMFPQDRLRRLDSSPHLVEYVVERVGPGIHSVDVSSTPFVGPLSEIEFGVKGTVA